MERSNDRYRVRRGPAARLALLGLALLVAIAFAVQFKQLSRLWVFLAAIGTGGRGPADIRGLAGFADVQFAAVCDVDLARARQIAMFLAREMTGASLNQIGRRVDQRPLDLLPSKRPHWRSVCRSRNLPVITFLNKLDRPGMEPLELLAQVLQPVRDYLEGDNE